MAQKKNIQGKNAHQQAPMPSKSSKKATTDQSFWKTLLEDKPRLFLYQKIAVFMIAFLVFANSIPNGFNMDDNYYTTKENTFSSQGLKAIPKIFTTHTLSDNSNSFDYRPIPMLSFVLQHQFISTGATTSHFINVLIYAFICLIVFLLLCHWLGQASSWFAFLVALLYAVHPLHTEVVDSIKSRDELMASLFALLSVLSIWKWHITGKLKHIVFSVSLFIIGILCKKTIEIYIAIVPLVFYFFTNMPLRKIILASALLFLSFFTVSAIATQFLPAESRSFIFIENPMMVIHQPITVISATASYILGWYAYLHVMPYPLSFYYGYEYVQLMNWNNVLPLVSLLPYLFLGYLAIKGIRKKTLIAFAAMFYMICIIPFSNLLGPAPGMMAERFAFTSSLGYCMLLVLTLHYFFKLTPGIFAVNKNTKYLVVTFLLLFSGYAGMSIVRNTQWENSWVLYSHDIQHLQKSAKANMMYGQQVMLQVNRYKNLFSQSSGEDQLRYRDSVLFYQAEEKAPFLRALEIDPTYTSAMKNLAVAYINEDSVDMARKYLLLANTSDPDAPDELHYYLGMVYTRMASKYSNPSFIDSSMKEYKMAISLNSKNSKAYWKLNLAYLSLQDTTAAINTLTTGISNVPEISLLYIEMAKIYLYKRDTAQFIHNYERAAETPNAEPALFSILETYYHNRNDVKKENYYRNKAEKFNDAAQQ